MTAPQPGDEVLIRGRVKQVIDGVGVRVELFSKTDQYDAWVREDLVADVIPAERTRTHAGHTVAATRGAIRMADGLIATRVDGPGSPANVVIVAKLRQVRAELFADLEAIGVPVEDEGGAS